MKRALVSALLLLVLVLGAARAGTSGPLLLGRSEGGRPIVAVRVGDAKNIRVLRRTASGLQTIDFNYKTAIRGGVPAYLRPGDTVVVPD